MNIELLGKKGEDIVRDFLKRKGYSGITRPDYEFEKEGKYISVEVKYKSESFKPPPFEGQGLNIYQIERREKRFKATGIRNLLLVVSEETKNIIGNWIDELEKGRRFDTFNKIRIYPLENFKDANELL